jgi:putative transposase
LSNGAAIMRGRADHPIKYAGMTVSEARRLKELEQENAKLKRLLAEAELDKAALKDLLSRKW